MWMALKRFWNNQKGVTLIELLAVVVILGIIAAIAAPSVMTNFNSAKVNSDAQTQAIIEDAAKRMVLDLTSHTRTEGINQPETSRLGYVKFDKESIELTDYLDVKSNDAQIPTAEDSNKFFRLKIVQGKVTVTIGESTPID
ncbi:hypothetical protein BEP19_05535 [Ammoniphilus oxalaticus]|uniref:Prepilin-type N-terminal cleavage/methylation domain-containing protein n=1 Tax=Ammoniphilus oxalaticus TaxID=66863 RepID=A0A419SIW0_9BACL|nr:prepilin-type N-terminal cleavage/methylation domain-containing protein [Ammoniphilus oxalaticus]RKD23889.1 hypothetical protein BEP19_05535 [Ammoniphilus oxalaticus]